jgi:hypothetical protein
MVPTSIKGADDFEPPTPSPLFPRDLATLLKFGPNEARTLAKDYGLLADIPEERSENVEISGVRQDDDAGNGLGTEANTGSDGSSIDKQIAEEKTLDRERNISRFMAHIGVRTRAMRSLDKTQILFLQSCCRCRFEWCLFPHRGGTGPNCHG